MIIKVKKYRWIDGYRNDNEAETIAEWEMLTDSPNRCISDIKIDREWEFLRWEYGVYCTGAGLVFGDPAEILSGHEV